jgi:protein-tyrosine kinase
MSRIHEALKKAEQERVVVPAISGDGNVDALPPTSTQVEYRETGIAASLPTVLPPGEAFGIMAPGYLRFEDLVNRCARPEWRPDSNMNVFSNSELGANGAEQFRTLRSRLYQIRAVRSLRTLLVTSSLAGEGKTFVTANLAQSIVRQPDRRVLIIDADLRCARLHKHLGAPSSPGLTDYLRGETDEIAVVQHGQEGNLCLIPAGTEVTNPSELLLNGRLKKLLDRVAPIFDWVIMDSPPCLPVADATILADSCDGVLMVVRAGVTPSEVAQRACQEMHEKNILGIVLNALQDDSHGTYYAQSYGYPDRRELVKDSDN